MLGTTLPTPIYALYAERMNFAVLTTTVIYATYAGGVLFALLMFGRWSDAVGRRPVLAAGLVAALASAVVFLVADSVPLLLVGRVLSGLSAGLVTGTATAAIIEAAPPKWRGRAAAVATVANIGGLGAGPLLAGVLVEYAPSPLHLTFIVHIALMVLAAIAILVVPETSPRTGRIGLQRVSVPSEVRAIFVIAAIAAFAGFAVTGLFTAVAPSFLSQVVGIEDHLVAGLVVCRDLRLLRPGSAGRQRNQTGAGDCSRVCDPDRRSGDSCCGAVFFVAGRIDNRRGGVRHRAGHQLQPRPGRGRREDTARTARRGQLDVLHRRLRRTLGARRQRGNRRPGTWDCAPPASVSPSRSACLAALCLVAILVQERRTVAA